MCEYRHRPLFEKNKVQTVASRRSKCVGSVVPEGNEKSSGTGYRRSVGTERVSIPVTIEL